MSASDSSYQALVAKYQTLKQEFESPRSNPDKCQELLVQLKMGLADLVSFDVSSGHTEALTLARDVLEIGAYWSIRVVDIPSFERYITQLGPYYYDLSSTLPDSPRMYPLLGLNLLRLLAQGRLADFHTALELVDPTELKQNRFIRHPVQLEQSLMEGSYKKVWNSRTEVPAPEYMFFMDILTSAIRNQIASCSEKAYDSLPLEDAATLLFFPRVEEVVTFAKERGWRVNSVDRKVYFGKDDTNMLDLPVDTVISQTLHYAKELEKIV
ncbi:regulatory particle non-ATPase [Dispira simplex]|nr:regulatory particle non-ATPase [Dispira simplex]